MEIKLIIIALELFFIIKNTKGVALNSQIVPNYGPHEMAEEISSLGLVVNDQTDEIPNQCVLIPDSQNNRIFVLSSTNDKDLICRRIVRTWTPDQPLYADEPKWIVIENIKGFLNNQKKHGTSSAEEPFYIARGKRLLKTRPSTYYHQSDINSRPSNMNNPLLEDLLIKDDLNALKNLNKKTNSVAKLNYLESQDKHADILGFLQEPFFISRGKKNMGEHLKNTKHKFGDYDDSSLRDRRGEDFLEQLFKEKDPFYVTRGKKGDQLQ